MVIDGCVCVSIFYTQSICLYSLPTARFRYMQQPYHIHTHTYIRPYTYTVDTMTSRSIVPLTVLVFFSVVILLLGVLYLSVVTTTTTTTTSTTIGDDTDILWPVSVQRSTVLEVFSTWWSSVLWMVTSKLSSSLVS